jgi:ATP-dependent DNA helicase DinG
VAEPDALDAEVEASLAAVVRAGPGRGEPRAGQLDMSRSVARAVRDGRGLVVQAGTGTGKTWAYLVGALIGLAARPVEGDDGAAVPHDDDGEAGTPHPKVIVATATKALQDQLAGTDLPAVAAGLDAPLRWAVLKGRANYLCRQAAAEAAGDPGGGEPQTLLADEVDPTPDAVAEEVARLIAWGEWSTTGDRATLDFEPGPGSWAAVSVGAAECPGVARCPRGESCFAEAAYRRARDADVVVVNTHLLGAHVASGGYVLPGSDVVVVDEAHEAPEIVASTLGVSLTPGRVRRLARSVRALGAEERAGLGMERRAEALAGALEPLVGRRLRGGAAGEAEVAEALAGLADDVRREHRRTRDQAAAEGLAARRERFLKVLAGLGEDVDALLHPGADDVTWVERDGRQPALRVTPMEVGGPLAASLWCSATPVLTSATVPPGLGRRLGLGPEAKTLDAGTPFDYRRQALLYVPRLPDRRDAAFDPAAHAEIEFLVSAAGGRTLALFTSWKAMQAARAALTPRLPYRVLAQGDLPKPALVEAFRGEETSCLFATMGFWQGVDVPGRSCSLVILDRLPFARPDDPLAEARRERAGAAAFAEVDVPHAAIRLAQGVGRLIRASSDRGVVAVLDRRLAEAAYRRPILAALPPMRRSRSRAEVSAFFSACEG